MGWGYGTLPNGKEIGYTVEATCEHPGCNAEIDRGLGYVCGSMHGEQGGMSCEGYFCSEHREIVDIISGTHAETELGSCPSMCAQCLSYLAFMDLIEEAEIYRADPKYQPNEGTRRALEMEDCKYLTESPQ